MLACDQTSVLSHTPRHVKWPPPTIPFLYLARTSGRVWIRTKPNIHQNHLKWHLAVHSCTFDSRRWYFIHTALPSSGSPHCSPIRKCLIPNSAFLPEKRNDIPIPPQAIRQAATSVRCLHKSEPAFAGSPFWSSLISNPFYPIKLSHTTTARAPSTRLLALATFFKLRSGHQKQPHLFKHWRGISVRRVATFCTRAFSHTLFSSLWIHVCLEVTL